MNVHYSAERKKINRSSLSGIDLMFFRLQSDRSRREGRGRDRVGDEGACGGGVGVGVGNATPWPLATPRARAHYPLKNNNNNEYNNTDVA